MRTEFPFLFLRSGLRTFLCFLSIGIVMAAEVATYHGDGFRFVPPPDWVDATTHFRAPDVVIVYGNRERTRSVGVQLGRSGKPGVMDASFVDDYISAYLAASKSKLLSHRFFELQGRRCLEFKTELSISGRTSRAIIWVCPLETGLLTVQAQALGETDPSRIREIAKCLKSLELGNPQ